MAGSHLQPTAFIGPKVVLGAVTPDGHITYAVPGNLPDWMREVLKCFNVSAPYIDAHTALTVLRDDCLVMSGRGGITGTDWRKGNTNCINRNYAMLVAMSGEFLPMSTLEAICLAAPEGVLGKMFPVRNNPGFLRIADQWVAAGDVAQQNPLPHLWGPTSLFQLAPWRHPYERTVNLPEPLWTVPQPINKEQLFKSLGNGPKVKLVRAVREYPQQSCNMATMGNWLTRHFGTAALSLRAALVPPEHPLDTPPGPRNVETLNSLMGFYDAPPVYWVPDHWCVELPPLKGYPYPSDSRVQRIGGDIDEEVVEMFDHAVRASESEPKFQQACRSTWHTPIYHHCLGNSRAMRYIGTDVDLAESSIRDRMEQLPTRP